MFPGLIHVQKRQRVGGRGGLGRHGAGEGGWGQGQGQDENLRAFIILGKMTIRRPCHGH